MDVSCGIINLTKELNQELEMSKNRSRCLLGKEANAQKIGELSLP